MMHLQLSSDCDRITAQMELESVCLWSGTGF